MDSRLRGNRGLALANDERVSSNAEKTCLFTKKFGLCNKETLSLQQKYFNIYFSI